MDRITRPLVRVGGVLVQSDWDDALAKVARAFAAVRPQAERQFGLFSCSKASNEVNYAAQKFARQVMGTNNIDSCNRT